LGYRVLMASAIKTIERDAVTIANEEMLIKQQPGGQLPEVSGQSLLSYKVMSENGTFVGTVSDLLLGVVPPVALRVAAFELGSGPEGRFSRPKIVDADEVVGYQDNVIVILDQVARGL
jgi:sporulation protein YlmC with PRC-barrel domain